MYLTLLLLYHFSSSTCTGNSPTNPLTLHLYELLYIQHKPQFSECNSCISPSLATVTHFINFYSYPTPSISGVALALSHALPWHDMCQKTPSLRKLCLNTDNFQGMVKGGRGDVWYKTHYKSLWINQPKSNPICMKLSGVRVFVRVYPGNLDILKKFAQ